MNHGSLLPGISAIVCQGVVPDPLVKQYGAPQDSESFSERVSPSSLAPRPPRQGRKVIAALIFCWPVLGLPGGKQLAPILGELVAILRRFGDLDIDDDSAAPLAGSSAAAIDRRLAPERTKCELKGRSNNNAAL